jgi:hypothetical protein
LTSELNLQGRDIGCGVLGRANPFRTGSTSHQHLQPERALSYAQVEDTMRSQNILIHAYAHPQKGGVTLTIEFGSRAAATLTLRHSEVEHLVAVIDQALGQDEDNDTTELPVIDADG